MNSTYSRKKWQITSSYFIILLVLLVNNSSGATKIIYGLLYLDNSPVSVEITDGIISRIRKIDKLPENAENVYIAPGLIDNQVNGYAGVTFALGSGELTLDGVKKATKALWEAGVTSYLPTLTTNKQELLLKNLSILAKAKKDPFLLGSIAGFHMEGPYISPVDGYRGAHPLEYARNPDWDEFMDLYYASERNILQVTIAPELEGAMEFISKCRNLGIVVALGHHNAPMATMTEAVDRGAQISTHLGNGCANLINRHTNPLWPQLSDDRLMASIICDGFHLLPEEIKVFYKVKGTEKIIVTSDVTSYGGLPPGQYTTAEGDTVEITPEGKLWNIAQNGLYGSATPIVKGIGNIMKVTGCNLGEAIQMGSTNPARLYGLNDHGEIKPGMRADLILFRLDDYNIKICKTIVAGQVVYSTR